MAEDRNTITGLKPPEFKELNAEGFKRWKRRFEIYRKASGADKKPEDVQVALLLHCMGETCIDIYATFEIDEKQSTYEEVITKFYDYFVPRENLSVNAHMFFMRNQNEGESLDQYLTELRKLAIQCKFGEQQERLIKDKLITGIIDKTAKNRLLREPDLTLQKAIEICKAAELSAERLQKTESSISGQVNKINNRSMPSQYPRSRSKSRSRTDTMQTFRQTTGRSTVISKQCQRCGKLHDKRNCPAYNKICLKCNKIGHFAKQCQSGRHIKQLYTNYKTNHNLITETKLNSVCINNVSASNRDWSENVYFVDLNKNLEFKLDTGAQCNVLPKNLCYKIGICTFEKSNLQLSNYNGDPIPTLGQVSLKCKIGKENQFITFQVCHGKLLPILGLDTIDKFKLIKRIPSSLNKNNTQIQKIDSKDTMLEKYKDVFEGLGQIKEYEYKIILRNDWQGKIEPCRHVPFKLLTKLKSELDNLEKIGVISKIEKPTDFVSSLVITSKPDGSIRVCLDPQYLNSQIKREHIMIPTLEEITSKLSGSTVFSTLDANKAFFMLKLSNDSKEFTTFITPYGRYYYNRLPFGLSSSPEVFHRVYKNIFKDIEGVEIYIDDVLIHARNEETHDKILEKVLKRAKESGIKFNIKKCQFKQKEVKYLGHILSSEGVKIDKNRVKAITEMREPKDQKELHRFLGMITYISRFIPNVSEVTAPLRELIKKDVIFMWGNRQQESYNMLKKLISEPPVLKYFQINQLITLSVDASKDGLGSVLLQNAQPVAYGSRALTDTEKLYSQIEKESLAILYGCTKFNQYLYGQKFVVETNHKPLVAIFSKPLNKCPIRLQRIRLALQPYMFELIYKPGKELLIADHLSRSFINDTSKTYDLDNKCYAHVAMVINNYDITDKKLKEIIEETAKDEKLVKIIKYIREGWPENKWQVESEIKCYYSYRDELGEWEGLIVKGNQIVIPKSMRKEILGKIHYAHLGIEKCKQLARKTIFWPNMSKEIEDLIQNCDTCKSFQNRNRKEEMIEKEIPEGPWQIVATDIFFLYRNPYILVVDAYSKFVEIEKLSSLSAQDTINSCKQIFARYGIPKLVYSDSGTQFTGLEFKKFSGSWNFEHKIVSPKHHQGNGLAERHIQTIKNILKKLIYDNKDIYLGLLLHRNTPIDNNLKTAAELMFNRNIRTIIPSFEGRFIKHNVINYREKLIEKQRKQKLQYDQGCRNLQDLTEGNVVKIQNESGEKPHKSGIVIGKSNGPRSYKIRKENGDIIVRNRRMLIKGGKYKDSIIDDWGDCENDSIEGKEFIESQDRHEPETKHVRFEINNHNEKTV
ncbi:uncharacterized protein K02A2.6 [Manduca sexta]|uniref:uncharacterized protein K02A2.6 n=1 Tax=Manduca sexta TaxID=7130 RepID=UPI00188F3959|nr:uncharacterized protein K02A2.6 [Manduca sexta]